jgi:nucleoside-diphosphate kinase
LEKTLAIIKPDGFAVGAAGEIVKRIYDEKIQILSMKMILLDKRKAEGFYYVHKSKPFFSTLIDFMTSGPIILMVLGGDRVIEKWRRIMGDTNPKKAEKDSIRAIFGNNIEKNAAHGSDSPESAIFEINYFFSTSEIFEINKDKVFNSGTKE